jgi:hypothetical protein
VTRRAVRSSQMSTVARTSISRKPESDRVHTSRRIVSPGWPRPPAGFGPSAVLDDRDAAKAEHPSVICGSRPMKISVQSLRRVNEPPQRQRH